MPRTGQPAVRRIAVVERAVAVLDALAASTADLGTNEIARRTGINASSVSRLLATLTSAGLVAHVPSTGRYRLGLRLLQLGNAALARLDLRDVARPQLVALAASTGETATLSVPGEREAITVDFVQGDSSVQSVARVGRPSVAHATAVGKLFLAHGGDLPDGPLAAYTARTLTDRDTLAEEVARTAARGWAEAVGERESDLNAIAAPVLGSRGELVAILGLQGPAGRFGRAAMRAALEPLLDSAVRISAGSSGDAVADGALLASP
jgi:DNA-binding IclR family transcriptional regulator